MVNFTSDVLEVRPRKDHRGVDLISDALPFGPLWYGAPDAIANPIALRQVLLPLKGHTSLSDRSKPPRTLTAVKAPIEPRCRHELGKSCRELRGIKPAAAVRVPFRKILVHESHRLR
jgi:hypothetical protein